MKISKKIVGIMLWIAGTLLLFIKLMSDITWPVPASIVAEIFGSLILTGLLLYNWLFGHQKGHRVHFLAIVLFAIMAGAIYFEKNLGMSNFNIIVAVYVASLAVLVLKFRGQINRDFNKGVERDHFSADEPNDFQ